MKKTTNNRKCPKIIRFFIPICLLSALLLQGCAKKDTKTEGTSQPSEVSSQTPNTVNKTFSSEEKELIINADVILPDNNSMRLVTLVQDKETAKQMAEELIISQYEDVNHSSELTWSVVDVGGEKALASFAVDEDSGITYYSDAEANINGKYYENEFMWSYNYITQTQPEGIDMTPTEAAETVCKYFEKYSDLSFIPYRVIAEAGDDGRDAYTVWAQASYGGVPICPRDGNGTSSLGIYAWISDEKIYGFQSVFMLRESESEEIGNLVSLDTVLEQLENSFSYISSYERVEISKITLEYFADPQSDGSYTLRPVWSFYGKTDGGFSVPSDWLCSYYADDGTLCFAGLLFY